MKWLRTKIAFCKWWLRQLDWVVQHGRSRMDSLMCDYARVREQLRSIQTMHVDVAAHPSIDSQVIMLGKVRGRDYVRIFNIHHKDMESLIGHLKQLELVCARGRIDAPYEMETFITESLNKEWHP